MATSPEDLYARGVELANAGRFPAALRALERARSASEDADLRARITGTMSYAITQVGDPEEAERMCLEVLGAGQLTAQTQAILYGQLGAIDLHRGRFDTAADWLGRSIRGLEDGGQDGDDVRAANMRMNRSLAFMRLGRLSEAADDLTVAERAYREAGLDSEVAQARHNAGYTAMLGGDLVGALEAMQSARMMLEAEPVWSAIDDVDRAEVLRDAGLTTDAERILERVIPVFGAHRLRLLRGEAELNLARSRLMHSPDRAEPVATAAVRRFRALGNETLTARAESIRLRALLSGGSMDGAGRRVRRARAVPAAAEIESVAASLDRLKMRGDAAALRFTAELWRARTEAPGASIPVIRVPTNAPLEVRLLAHEVRAQRAVAAGRDADARKHAALGLGTLGGWQQSFGSLDLQSSIQLHGKGLMYTGLGAALRSRRADVVFEWSERARHLSQQVVPLRPSPDPATAADLAELRVIRVDNPSGDWLADPRAALLQDRARSRQWTRTGSAEVEERVTLEEFQGALDDDTALLSYVFSGDAVSCLVVTRTSTTLLGIDEWASAQRAMRGLRADLDMAASVRGVMGEVVRQSLDERLAALSAALLDGPMQIAGGRRILLAIPGILAEIPWAMLPPLRGRTFSIASSATRWHRQHAAPLPQATVAGFAAGPRVARAEEEVGVAAEAWARPQTPGPQVLTGAGAQVDAVTDLASVVDVLHVAAHGRHASDNPLFSGLELADGALFGYDIDRMPRVPQIVVLSACELGRSSVRWGQEAVGMTRTWLHAGSRSVIAAPVIVADDVACELLGAMHHGLSRGRLPAEALAEASAATGLVAPFQCHGLGF